MQLIVAHTFCPGVVDSSDWVAEDLETALKENGHEVETMSLPFDPMSSPLEQVLAFRLFGPVEHGDILVALHAPCHVTSHRRKVIWGVDDAFRSEDLMPPGYFTNGGASETIRESLRRSDRAAYGEAHRVFLRSRIACEEFFRETGVHADFLPLPPRRLAPGADSESMLAARTGGVRISLLLTVLEALATSTSSLRLKLFGPRGARPQWRR